MSTSSVFDVNYLPATAMDFVNYLNQFGITNYTTATADQQQWIHINNNFCLLTIPACSLKVASVEYLPKVLSDAILLGIFGVYLLLCLGIGIRYKMWGHTAGTFFGFLLEVLGYAGRIELHKNPFLLGNFLLYLIPLTIGPAFLSAAIYLCLSRIIVVYGEGLARFKPRTYTVAFVVFDFFSLVLQGAGGGITSTANPGSSGQQAGVDVMIAGLAWQVVSIIIFISLTTDYYLSVKRAGPQNYNPHFATLRNSKYWTAFLWSLAAAIVLILVRSVYRVAELQQGFSGSLANDEGAFLALEGVMIVLAGFLITAFHPGLVFKGEWSAANFTLRTPKHDPTAEKLGGRENSIEGQHGFMSSNV